MPANNKTSELPEYVKYLEDQIDRLSEIGVALSREKEIPVVLEMIIDEARRITNADGGTLYMMIDDETRLKFEIMQTGSKGIRWGGASPDPVPEFIYPIKLYNPETGKPNYQMISAYVALKGETINIPDAYEAEGFDFSGMKAFDKRNDYRSMSFLTVPLKNHLDEIIGVIQLINAQDPESVETIPFSEKKQKLIESLCSQAAVSITNSQLIQQLEDLFESFIQVIAAAIDAKSPYTGGHCQRIPVITKMIVEAINKAKEGPFADVYFDEESMKEIMLAAWLHDTGKVATPVHVVDKSTKLESLNDRIDMVIARFEVLKRDAEIRFIKKRMKLENEGKGDKIKELKKQYEEELAKLDKDKKFIETCNLGGEFLSQEYKERIKKIANYKWQLGGETRNFLSDDEVYNLSLSRGTLNPEERKIINDHTVVTIDMLKRLPWPKKLRRVPEIAAAHHEKLDGTGYPKGLNHTELPIHPRIVAIADIFEALTASDRPYKKGKTVSQSLRIMGFMRNDYHIDSDIFDLFVKEKVYEQYAKEYLPPEQLDEVVI
ncbi:MAG: GAF domain-containing protein [Candidatus Marinimicrobia bacterium]|nr:GAF domain-containing protein [Candidatus Neomarinimicrobiota bacterium]